MSGRIVMWVQVIALVGFMFVCSPQEAFARPHHRVHHYRHTTARPDLPTHSSLACDRHATYIAPCPAPRTGSTSPGHRWAFSVPTVSSTPGGARPRDCYGIPWCGCWLKHQFGLAGSHLNLNLAIAWARVGSPASPDLANVVVWPHHVGKLLQHVGDRILVQSGNDGNAVRTRWRTTHGVVAYRRV